jgi:NADH-quinone oxidoreductase subunit E
MKTGAVLAGTKIISTGEKLEFTPEDKKKIQEFRARYPERASAVMPALWLAQERFGFLSDGAMGAVAEELELPKPEVIAVATFYSMYNLEPVGKYIIQICCTLSCSLMGADALVVHLKRKLGIEFGETTPDGKFTLRKVECLASCGTAPMMQINEENFHENLTLEKVDQILDSLP